MDKVYINVLGEYNSWISDFREMDTEGFLYIEKCEIIGLEIQQMEFIESTFDVKNFKFLDSMINIYDIESFSYTNGRLFLDFWAADGMSGMEGLYEKANDFKSFLERVMEELGIVQEFEIIMTLDFFEDRIRYDKTSKYKDVVVDNSYNTVKNLFRFEIK